MDTIFALATPPGKSGIAVIRISGKECCKIIKKLGIVKSIKARYTTLHKVYHPISQELIDEALVIYFAGPNSFTGEDCLELHIHGSMAVIENIFESLSILDNVRPAEAGEFSYRAFLNGKMDLIQAEAIADLIDSETSMQQKQALRQMSGALSDLYNEWRNQLINILSLIEAYIDFPDEELPEKLVNELNDSIKYITNSISKHLNDNNKGEKLRQGIYVTILGKPNVGKSSLLNHLAKRDVAIVSDIAGTTRDIIDIKLDIAGYAFVVSDTAGIRITEDKIENMGIDRALNSAKNSDLKIVMFDAETEFDQQTEQMIDQNTIVLINKVDFLNSYDSRVLSKYNAIPISIKNNYNIDVLINRMADFAHKNYDSKCAPLITRYRHRKYLNQTLDCLELCDINMPIELLAQELRSASDSLGKIMGKIYIEEILDEIFSKFCIGK